MILALKIRLDMEKKRLFLNDTSSVKDNFKKYSAVESVLVRDSCFRNRPSFTVAIPTFKRSILLKETIDSVLSQEDADDVEILIVDNNPERYDETENLINTYSDQRIKYYKNAQNIGMTGNWNRLYSLARTEWVSMLHDDDCLLCGYIQFIKRMIEKKVIHSEALFVCNTTNQQVLDQTAKIKYYSPKKRDLCMSNIIPIAGNVLKRNMVFRLGGFDEDFYPSADYHFWTKIVLFSKATIIYGRPLAYYRIGYNTSCKVSTIMGFIEKDNILKASLLCDDSRVSRWIMTRALSYYEYCYLIRAMKQFNVESELLYQEIKKREVCKNRINKFCLWYMMKYILLIRRIKVHLCPKSSQL